MELVKIISTALIVGGIVLLCWEIQKVLDKFRS